MFLCGINPVCKDSESGVHGKGPWLKSWNPLDWDFLRAPGNGPYISIQDLKLGHLFVFGAEW